MTNSKKKQTGLGVASYFDNLPSLDEPSIDSQKSVESPPPSKTATTALSKPEKKKIRRTYALSEDSQFALELMKLEARKQGENVTLGDLMEEAVTLLMEKRGIQIPQESNYSYS